MSTGRKVLIAAGVTLAVLMVATTAVVASAVVTGGVARVSIHTPDGPDLDIAVPGVLISAAAATGSRVLTAHGHHHGLLEKLDHGGDFIAVGGIGDVGDLLREMLAVLEEIPDATLVEVEDGDDLVRVVKRGRHLRVRVIDGGEDLDLEVSLPIRTARRTAAYLLG